MRAEDKYPKFDEIMYVFEKVEELLETLKKAEPGNEFHTLGITISPDRGYRKISLGSMDYIETESQDGSKFQTQSLWHLDKPAGRRIQNIMQRTIYENVESETSCYEAGD